MLSLVLLGYQNILALLALCIMLYLYIIKEQIYLIMKIFLKMKIFKEDYCDLVKEFL